MKRKSILSDCGLDNCLTAPFDPMILHALKEAMWESENFFGEILLLIMERMDYAIAHRDQILFIRYDFRYPTHYNAPVDNGQIGTLLRQVQRHIRKEGFRNYSVAVREQNLSKNQHYHVVFILDGKEIKNGWHWKEDIEGMWSKILGCDAVGTVHVCAMTPSKIHRSSAGTARERRDLIETYLAVIDHLAYLAKTATKSTCPPHVRKVLKSHLPKMPEPTPRHLPSPFERTPWLWKILPTLRDQVNCFELGDATPRRPPPRKPRHRG